jgi:ABC-2 type transport system ATP-binding protein
MLEDPQKGKESLGYLPENAPLYSDMTVASFLGFCAELRGITGAARSKAVDRVLDLCFLDSVRNQSVDTLSKGFRHRTCFAQSIIHDPEVLILDEPTDGLDPNQKQEIRQLIRRMGETKAIIFSTHILEEVDASCTRAIIIDRGRVIADGTPAELKARATNAGAVLLRATGLAGSGIRSELEKLEASASVEVIASDENGITARITPAKGKATKLSSAVFGLCKEKNLAVEELRVEEGRLDLLFREITKSDSDQ